MKTSFRSHPVHGKCLYLENGVIEAGVPLDFGLRVAHFSFSGEENVFFEQPRDMVKFTNEKGWRIRGGHRLWLAPERKEDYAPDNDPVAFEIRKDSVLFTQKKDPLLGVIKSFELSLKENKMKILHRVRNVSGEKMRVSLWALSVLKPGGVLTVPLKEREGGMDPLHRLSLWDYTTLSDDRFHFEKNRIQITQRPALQSLKIGVGHPASPPFYERGDTVFYKHIPFFEGKEYPDGGVSFEVFVSDYMTEIEGLSPLFDLLPEKEAVYEEILELGEKRRIQ